MTSLVVDASVAIKWFVPEDGTDDAEALAASGRRLLAPRLIRAEVANAFRRLIGESRMTPDQALERLDTLDRSVDRFIDEDELLRPAMVLAASLKHPVYDVLYLETARSHDAVMITADRHFIRKLASSGSDRLVRHLDHWREAVA